MFSTVLSATLDGLKVEFVRVEVDISNGLPMFHMVGYLSSEVKEASERVRTALQNAGISLPPKRMTVNLSPGTVKKRGAAFDLPIAIAILASFQLVQTKWLDRTLVIGELGLDGRARNVPGILPIVLAAKEAGYECCLIPGGNEREASFVQGIEVNAVSDLQEAVACLSRAEGETWCSRDRNAQELFADIQAPGVDKVDFHDIRGQGVLKRAAEIAVAGQHNLLMVGTPGASKTMIAKRVPTILPPLSLEESLEISKVYSVMGLLEEEHPLITERPFREVHHTATKTALVGGGLIPRPGEISLANGGVLMMDELAEFQKSVLEVLRQPLEEQEIRITRAKGTYRFPADFLLIAATNPCPCGYFPDMERCTCMPGEINAYIGRISQAFLSRMDICVEAPRVKYEELNMPSENEGSAEIRVRVCEVREVQKKRYQDVVFQTNGRIPAQRIMHYCPLDQKGKTLMQKAYDRFGLTARTYHKILRVARTIADLDHREFIEEIHLAEALNYRVIDQKYWGKGQ